MPIKIRRLTNEARGKTVISFLTLGYGDYLAARKLLNSDLILQGATLASTSVEKYLKAVMGADGILVKIHLDNPKLLEMLKDGRLGSELYSKINHEFVALLGKVFRLRYLDEIDPGLTFVLQQTKLLAELDRTVRLIDSGIGQAITHLGGHYVSSYGAAVREEEPYLFENNYILQGIERKEFIERYSDFYGIVVGEEMNIFMVAHDRIMPKDDGHFLKGGLKIIDETHVDVQYPNMIDEVMHPEDISQFKDPRIS
jgi:hypothetical protein